MRKNLDTAGSRCAVRSSYNRYDGVKSVFQEPK